MNTRPISSTNEINDLPGIDSREIQNTPLCALDFELVNGWGLKSVVARGFHPDDTRLREGQRFSEEELRELFRGFQHDR